MADRKITYSFVVARSLNNIIGCENRLPWHLPSDLKKFRAITINKPVIMGRRTYDSIGKPLPDRVNIVISRENGIHHRDVVLAHDKQTVMKRAEEAAQALGASEVAVIGGEQVFEMFESEVTKVYLTVVHASVEGDAKFSRDFGNWDELSREFHSRNGTADDYDYTVIVYTRRAERGGLAFRSEEAFEIA